MNLITTACADALLPVTEYACGGLKGNRINALIVGRSDMTVTVSGAAPTYAEMVAGIAATGDNHLVVLRHISNGLIDEVGSSELTDLDTESGLPEKFNVQMGLTGMIKHPTAEVYTITMGYNIHPTLRIWVIDNKGYIWGGKTGYLCGGLNAFSPKKMDGVTQFISFNLVYVADSSSDDTALDTDFLTLDN
jgi:hypothetical protein